VNGEHERRACLGERHTGSFKTLIVRWNGAAWK